MSRRIFSSGSRPATPRRTQARLLRGGCTAITSRKCSFRRRSMAPSRSSSCATKWLICVSPVTSLAGSLRTEGGQLIVADQVVLAMGNQPPQDPAGVARQTAVRRYASDPWGPSLLEGLGADEPIALIGSGLSAVDVVVEANSRGHRGVIYAISRHGLLPRRHQPAAARPQLQFGADCTTARSLLKAVRAEAAKCQAEGGDWRSVIDGIRPVAQSLWRSLKTCERERFLRHLASRWDVHRHRLAPEIDDLLQARMAENRLVVIAGRVRGARGSRRPHSSHVSAPGIVKQRDSGSQSRHQLYRARA